jgi:hypothetical protein
MAASHHPPSEYRPAAPAEENRSPTTVSSRACRGCPKGWPRTPQSTVHLLPPLAFTRLKASQTSRLGMSRLYLVHGLLPLPVGLWPRLNNAAPSLQPHYRTILTTTDCSVPVLRIGTLALAGGAACGLSLHAFGVTEPRFSRSIRKPGRASRRLHAGCRSGRIRHPSSSSRRKDHPPVLTSPTPLSTLRRRFACARLSRPCLPGSSSRRFRNTHNPGS